MVFSPDDSSVVNLLYVMQRHAILHVQLKGAVHFPFFFEDGTPVYTLIIMRMFIIMKIMATHITFA